LGLHAGRQTARHLVERRRVALDRDRLGQQSLERHVAAQHVGTDAVPAAGLQRGQHGLVDDRLVRA
jgi:hypothetical protein